MFVEENLVVWSGKIFSWALYSVARETSSH